MWNKTNLLWWEIINESNKSNVLNDKLDISNDQLDNLETSYFKFNELNDKCNKWSDNSKDKLDKSMDKFTRTTESKMEQWQNEWITSLLQRWWEIMQRKNMKSPVTKKSWKKPFSHKQGLSISKTNQAHIVEYFSVLKLTLSFLCWLIQHHHLKIHSIIELVNSLNKMMTLENFLLYQTCWKRMAFEIQPPHLKNGDKYYRRAFIFSVPSTENSGTALETFLQNICNGIVKVIFTKFFINLLSSMVFCPLNFIYISQICTDEELTKWQYTKKYAPLYKMNL